MANSALTPVPKRRGRPKGPKSKKKVVDAVEPEEPAQMDLQPPEGYTQLVLSSKRSRPDLLMAKATGSSKRVAEGPPGPELSSKATRSGRMVKPSFKAQQA